MSQKSPAPARHPRTTRQISNAPLFELLFRSQFLFFFSLSFFFFDKAPTHLYLIRVRNTKLQQQQKQQQKGTEKQQKQQQNNCSSCNNNTNKLNGISFPPSLPNQIAINKTLWPAQNDDRYTGQDREKCVFP